MKENKPILFINTATTNNFYQQNQSVYDSRKKNDKVVKKPTQPKIEMIENIEEEKIEMTSTEENYVYEEQIEEVYPVETHQEVEAEPTEENTIEVINEPEIVQVEKPFANKIRLLTKRANLNRYVLVAVVLEDGEIEGLFKDSNEEFVIIETDTEEHQIMIDDIVDIRIIRV